MLDVEQNGKLFFKQKFADLIEILKCITMILTALIAYVDCIVFLQNEGEI